MSKKTRIFVSVENLCKAKVLPLWLENEAFFLHSVQILPHLHGADLMNSLQFAEGNPYSTDSAYCFLVALMGALEDSAAYPQFYKQVYELLTGNLEQNYHQARNLCYDLSDFAKGNYQTIAEAKLFEIFLYEYICQWMMDKNHATYGVHDGRSRQLQTDWLAINRLVDKNHATYHARLNISFANIYKFSLKLYLVGEHLLREYFE